MQIEHFGTKTSPPLSAAVRVGEMIYVSGQVGADAEGNIPAGFEAQTRQTLDNVRAVLEDMGSGMDKVVKTTCFILSKEDFGDFNRVYAEYFGSNPPARSTVAVKELMRPELVVEIEAIAIG